MDNNQVNILLHYGNEEKNLTYKPNNYSELKDYFLSYYNEKIFLNFQTLIIYEIAFLILVCVLSLLTFYKNDPKETIEFGFGEKKDDKKVEKKSGDENEDKKKSMVKKALYSKRSVKLSGNIIREIT